jgi:hypothetical protein
MGAEVELLRAEVAELLPDDPAAWGPGDVAYALAQARDALTAAREDVALLRTRSREAAATIERLTRERDDAARAQQADFDSLYADFRARGEAIDALTRERDAALADAAALRAAARLARNASRPTKSGGLRRTAVIAPVGCAPTTPSSAASSFFPPPTRSRALRARRSARRRRWTPSPTRSSR